MTYRVIQWATGLVGQEAIKGIVSHPELDLVGCWVHSEVKVGRDAGEIAGIGPTGVLATHSIDEICALDADAVVYSPMLADEGEVLRLIGSGKNIITPIGYIFPRAGGRTAEVEAACVEAGVTLHGTGIHPGGITERFPLTFSALCRDIRHVRMEEFSDIRNYATASVVRDIMLFGQAPEVAAQSPMLKVLANGFLQSVDMVAHELGWTLDAKKRTKHEMSVATRPIGSPVGVIEPGTVAAQRFTWQGTVNGEPVITVRTNWMMDDGHLSDGWQLGEQRFEVEVDSTDAPPLLVTFHGLHPPVLGEDSWIGLIAAAMHCVNAIPYVVKAEPGIKTYLDLPLIAGRAAAR
jgi:2,4-diaminopentanoate dehydrogenase